MPATTAHAPNPRPFEADEDRPRFAIGHLGFTAADVPALTDFYERVGMRRVMTTDDFAIIELRGGTHIIIRSGPAGEAELDLMVDDIDEAHQVFAAQGPEPTPIRRGNPHDRFSVTDPEGNRLAINSDHSIGPV